MPKNLPRTFILTNKQDKDGATKMYAMEILTPGNKSIIGAVSDRKKATIFSYDDALYFRNNRDRQSDIARTQDWLIECVQ